MISDILKRRRRRFAATFNVVIAVCGGKKGEQSPGYRKICMGGPSLGIGGGVRGEHHPEYAMNLDHLGGVWRRSKTSRSVPQSTIIII